MLGIARNFRTRHGDEKFATLARVVFEDADTDKSGAIDIGEFHTMLNLLEKRMSRKDVFKLVQKIDESKNQLIQRKERAEGVETGTTARHRLPPRTASLVDRAAEERPMGAAPLRQPALYQP